MLKKTEMGPFLSRPVLYVTRKNKKNFFGSVRKAKWFNLTPYFVELLQNQFGQFVWIEKRVTIIVAFHFLKRRLKCYTRGSNTSLNACGARSLITRPGTGAIEILCVL